MPESPPNAQRAKASAESGIDSTSIRSVVPDSAVPDSEVGSGGACGAADVPRTKPGAAANPSEGSPQAARAENWLRRPERLCGQRVGDRYQLEEHLPQGGLGLAFIASSAALEEPLLIKLVPRPPELSPEHFAWQVRKAVSLAHFENRHVAPIRNFGVFGADGGAFLVRAFQPGMSLREYLAAASAPSARIAVAVVSRLAVALSEAHSREIFHGRLKPDNVILGPSGELRLVDFGCSQLPEGCERLSVAAAQADATPVTAAHTLYAPPALEPAKRDLCALGAMLVEMLTGRRPPLGVESLGQTKAVLAEAEAPPALASLALSLLSGAPLSLEEARRQVPEPLGSPDPQASECAWSLPQAPDSAGKPSLPDSARASDSGAPSHPKSRPWVAQLQQLFGRSKTDPLE